jgi:hypothetical protein
VVHRDTHGGIELPASKFAGPESQPEPEGCGWTPDVRTIHIRSDNHRETRRKGRRDWPCETANRRHGAGTIEAHGEWGPPSAALHYYTANCDELFERALRAGGKLLQPMKDQFHGDRAGELSISGGITGILLRTWKT